jgi:Skp family chaperone for outer membrane proteins
MTVQKKLRIATFSMLLAIALPASSAIVVPDAPKTNSTAATENPRAQQLLQRLDDIKDMSKSDMTRMEKKGLRKEVKDIKKEMKVIKGGVYLSVGAIIIVILLLILLL